MPQPIPPFWIDTHCHLDAPEFAVDRLPMRQAASQAGVGCCVIPAVAANTWAQAIQVAKELGDAYALGIHPLYTRTAQVGDLAGLAALLEQRIGDAELVAVGEIGLDYFVALDNARQELIYREQLKLAKAFGLPVILHVRRSVDKVLKHLREVRFDQGGIAHAFNGSLQQAKTFLDMGFKLGFGGAVTYERALQLRRLVVELPADAIVMETDSPDIPPHWLYATVEERAAGIAQGRNSPVELPRIAEMVAQLRGVSAPDWMAQTYANSMAALPRLAPLLAPA